MIGLTRHQTEILLFIGDGKTQAEIVKRFSLSANVVSECLRGLIKKGRIVDGRRGFGWIARPTRPVTAEEMARYGLRAHYRIEAPTRCSCGAMLFGRDVCPVCRCEVAA